MRNRNFTVFQLHVDLNSHIYWQIAVISLIYTSDGAAIDFLGMYLVGIFYCVTVTVTFPTAFVIVIQTLLTSAKCLTHRTQLTGQRF